MNNSQVDRRDIILVLKRIIDPELGMNIYDLGLIYGIEIDNGEVIITLTLTSPTCPYGAKLLEAVKIGVQHVQNVKKSTLNLVWDPPWDTDYLPDSVKLELGILW